MLSLHTIAGTDSNSGGDALVSALGKLVITLAFTGVSAFLLATAQAVPPELWTLNVGIVSSYLTQRSGTSFAGTK